MKSVKSVKSVIPVRTHARVWNLPRVVERDQESVTSLTSMTKTRAQLAVPWESVSSCGEFCLSSELYARD